MKLPTEKQQLLKSIVDDLKDIEHIEAIVLGGSFAEGTAGPSSDLDIGLYYYSKQPFDIKKVAAVIKKYEISASTITDFYGWGKWVNGGAWITTKHGQVDLLYKNIDQISETIEKSKDGHWENDFEQQPPYGFSSMIFLAETYYSIPLFDPNNRITYLKKEVEKYPLKLKENILKQSLWAAEFTIWQAQRFKPDDFYNIAGCLTRALKNITTALYALNEIYPLGDKRTVERLVSAKIKPDNLKNKINSVLLAENRSFDESINNLRNLYGDVLELVGDLYKPVFQLKN